MMENRPKLQINRNMLLSEKSPPPTKLLINHGKPNFTIVKSPKTVSPPPCEVNIFCGEDLKPSALKKKSPPKITTNPTNGTDNSPSSDEFLRLHKKIGGRNFDEIENNNNNATIVHAKQSSPVADQHFATIQKNYILTLKSPAERNGNHVENNTNGLNGNGEIRPGFEKSSSPDNSTGSSQTSRSSTPQSNGNASTDSVTSAPAINFEQRTVVSFSRDLSVTPNRYPDTVKTIKTVETTGDLRSLPKEFSALKFEIAADGELVRPVKKNAA